MWRRTYLLLFVIRLYFAVSPSYIHPDEIFQGPEVIAGELFGWKNVRTWEWTVAKPIRSVFPLWPIYGIPMALLKALWSREGDGSVSPTTIYYTLRMAMFALCFMMETYAIHELIPSPRKRKQAVLLVASSYVTWTYQTHTFSNSVETLVVLWCLVLMQRISGGPNLPSSPIDEKPSLISTAVPRRLHIGSGLALGFLLVFGIFNRITFPAFLLIPGTQVLPHLLNRPLALIALLVSATITLFIAIATDTAFYTGPAATSSFRALFRYIHTVPIITPINNVLYNTKASNLKAHGLHPHYQHVLINIPQLLGPALLFLPHHWGDLNRMLSNSRLCAALTGTIILSVIPHQEPRFLLPCIPLLLTCVRLPQSPTWRRRFWIVWGMFNIAMATLMGIYHQGGVVPISLSLPTTISNSLTSTLSQSKTIDIYWWKTYPPSLSLLGPELSNPNTNETLSLNVTPLLGAPKPQLFESLLKHQPPCDETMIKKFTNAISSGNYHETILVAPFSAFDVREISQSPLGNFTMPADKDNLQMIYLGGTRRHINLDGIDFPDDGVLGTFEKLIGRRGLGVWRVEKVCETPEKGWFRSD